MLDWNDEFKKLEASRKKKRVLNILRFAWDILPSALFILFGIMLIILPDVYPDENRWILIPLCFFLAVFFYYILVIDRKRMVKFKPKKSLKSLRKEKK
jgi:drug/metabolite transporter (DMT)-like permease